LPRTSRLFRLAGLGGLLLLLAALPGEAALPEPDLYLELAPGGAAGLARDFPELRITPLLPAPLMRKLGLPDWVRARPPAGAPDLLARLRGHAAVRLAEPVPLFRTSAWVADDPALRAQWHLERLGAVAAWQRSRGGPAAVVGIVDTGVDWRHPDLAAGIHVNPGEDLDGDGRWSESDGNGLDDDLNGLVDDGVGWDLVDLPPEVLWPGEDGEPADNDPADFNGHGTHCAGDAAAVGYNGLGVASPAPAARILPIRAGYTGTDGMGYVSHGLEGMLLAAASGARVISMSFGGPGGGTLWQQAVTTLHAQGVVLLAAAGNENSTQRSYPAAFDEVIAVGATDPADQRADFSNYGSWVDLAAPGVAILSTATGGGYTVMQGTSMATPVAAGVAAQVLAVHPDWGAGDVLARLAATAEALPGQQLGAGRVDAARALAPEAWVEALGVAGSGRLPVNTPGRLRLAVHAGERALAQGVLEVTGLDPRLPFATVSLELGQLRAGESDTLELELEPLWTEPGLAELRLQGRLRDGGEDHWQGELPLACGVTELLLLEGDSSDNWSLLGWYVEALTSQGRAPEVQQLAWSSAAELPWSRARLLLLFSGSDLEPQFEPALEDSLRAFLTRGGRAVLSGQRLAGAFSPAFLQEAAGAGLTEEAAASVQVWGAPGAPDVADLHLLLTGSGGAGNQSDPQVLEALGGTPLFTWNSGGTPRLAGLRAPDGRLDLLAFGLEAVNGDPEWGADLAQVLEILLPQATVLPPRERPRAADGLACWPNPFNPALQLRNTGSRPLRLSVHNALGQRVAELGALGPGEFRSWRPSGLAGGRYWIRAAADGREASHPVLWLP